MSILESLLLGFIQGVTEFLPVSSSGHLVVFQQLRNLDAVPILFDVILHGATLACIFVFFRREIFKICKGALTPSAWKTSANTRILLFIIAGTIPTGVIGILGEKIFARAFHSIQLTGCMFFITAGLLFLAARTKRHQRGISEISLWSAVLIGCIQGLAIFPGFSRSGATICLAVILGWEKELAFKFSFLLVIPAILGALILQAIEYVKTTQSFTFPCVWWMGIITAFGAGLISLFVLWKTLQNKKLIYFAWYCIILGILVLGISLV
ncbi:MAG: undecaprenyl-diphosphate phosphatase [bacterium]